MEGIRIAMSPHYYSQKPSTSGKKTTISTKQFNHHFTFKSQSGVFSWQKIDAGSELLLNNLDLPGDKKINVLDIGCGYGFLGIVLAKIYPEMQITLTDINILAVKLTRHNCKLNNVEENTTVVQGDLFEPVENTLFDLIITNPPLMAGKKVLKALVKNSKKHLKKNGHLQLVVPKKKGLKSMQNSLVKTFRAYTVLAKGGGYWVLKAQKS